MKLKFSPLAIKIKGGKSVVIRQGETSDGAGWVDLITNYLIGSETIPLLPDEFKLDHKTSIAHIENYSAPGNNLLLIAEHDGSMIGNIDLTSSPRQRMAHTARIGMGIAKGWRNQGLGQAMLGSVLDWAHNSSSLELIWLDVYDTNIKGVKLYQKMGFVESGRIPRFFKHEETYIDKVKMYLQLK